jgi:hypothetical protein
MGNHSKGAPTMTDSTSTTIHITARETLEQQRNLLGSLIIATQQRGDISTARWLEQDLMRLDARMAAQS